MLINVEGDSHPMLFEVKSIVFHGKSIEFWGDASLMIALTAASTEAAEKIYKGILQKLGDRENYLAGKDSSSGAEQIPTISLSTVAF